MRKARNLQDRRQFIRVDRIFPVEFQFIDQKTGNAISSWHQGFTDNVSRGGIGLTVNDPELEVVNLVEQKPDVALKIKMPFSGRYIHAKAEFCWLTRKKDDDVEQYFIGLSYKEINPLENKRILKYAYIKKFTPIVALGVIVVLFASISFSFYFNIKLIKSNLGLAHDLFSIIHKSRKAKNVIKEIKKEHDEADLKLSQLVIKTQNLNEKLIIAQDEKEKEFFQAELININTKIDAIKQDMQELYIKEAQITEDLLSVEKKKLKISSLDIQQMYNWLKSLVDEQGGQIKISGVSNQGQFLAVQLCSIFGDYDKASNILNSYFKNTKNSLSQDELQDFLIAAIKYSYLSRDVGYLDVIKDLIKASCSNLKINNSYKFRLKLYAVLDMYLKLKWDHELNEQYKLLSQTLNFPDDPEGEFEYLLIFNFGKIANLDIAAIITNFEDKFSCTKDYILTKDNKNMQIKGFKFSEDKTSSKQNFAADTIKMVLIYKLTAKFFETKHDIYRAKFYREKAFNYLNELSFLITAAENYKFMPYIEGPFTTQADIASTAYVIFAYYNYNPFGLDES